jgi:adenine-specific DNA-methyltransferase
MPDNTNPIPPVTRDDPAAHSGDVVGENVAALKSLFPSIVTDGKVDFEVLRQLLGDQVEEGAERYGLNWKGKARARAFALTPSLGTLRPAKADSKDWDTTKNIVIEGDNLEVLKLLGATGAISLSSCPNRSTPPKPNRKPLPISATSWANHAPSLN